MQINVKYLKTNNINNVDRSLLNLIKNAKQFIIYIVLHNILSMEVIIINATFTFNTVLVTVSTKILALAWI